MPTPVNLRVQHDERGMTPNQCAAFIGTSEPWYWHLFHDGDVDEMWTLRVSEFLRFCVLFKMPPYPMLTEFGVPYGPPVPLPVHDEAGQTHIAAYLLERCGDLSANEDEIGWEAGFLASWLSDDCALGLMPMIALDDICEYVGVGTATVLTATWNALGQ